jgi:hypothetical protein
VAATPAGGTTTRGATTPTAALAGATTTVGRGSRTRSRRDGGWRAGRSPGSGRTPEAGVGASFAMASSSRRSSFHTTWKVGKGMLLLMRAFMWP